MYLQGNFDGFSAEDEPTILTGFTQPTFQIKRKLSFTDFKFAVSKISYFFNMMMAALLKDTLRQLCV